ncbi:hypothetical protein, partial [Clostridium perfringens]
YSLFVLFNTSASISFGIVLVLKVSIPFVTLESTNPCIYLLLASNSLKPLISFNGFSKPLLRII